MTNEADLSHLLGDESPPIHFPNGLIGLENWKDFSLISHPEAGDLRLLQSLQDDRLSLILMDPRLINTGYKIAISDVDAKTLDYPRDYRGKIPDDLDVYCILSVQDEPFFVTVNMLGPVIINWEKQLGKQVVQANSNYNPRYPLAGSETAEGGE